MSAPITGKEPHPVIPLPTEDALKSMDQRALDHAYMMRRELMLRMEGDPLHYGYEPVSWKRSDDKLAEFRAKYPVGVLIHLVLGGHRASKTEWRGKRTIENMLVKPAYKIWACQATQEASREAQQRVMYKYIPNEFKSETGRYRVGAQAKINYTPWNGFTEDVFAFPSDAGPTSECRFKFYSMNPRSLEGAEIDEGWLDEEAPLEWLEAVIFRLATRNGTLFLTFTPRWGYTQTVKAVLNGATTIEETDAELLCVKSAAGDLLGYEKVPLVQENLAVTLPGTKAKAAIVYFHSSENPYGGWETIKANLEGGSRDKILTVAYGVPTKAMLTRFPLFNDLVHIVSINRFREIQRGGGTWYQYLDPCSGRNWFQQWIFVDPLNRAFVAGESPSFGHEWAYIPGVGDPGPWAIAGAKADGEQGEGQKEWGWGYDRYLEEMERMERLLALGEPGGNGNTTGGLAVVGSSPTSPAHKIDVSTRWIDARYGNARRTSEERSTTLIEDLSAKNIDFLAAPSEKSIDSGRGGGDGSLRMINDKLFYLQDRPIDHTNQPHLYVVETCPNTIYALKEWTGKDGQHGATKDPIDCLRMFVLSGCEHVDEAMLQPKTPWMAQFPR
jgi:hypothetical protein